MTVVFFPDYTDTNPYQTNLAAALDEDVTFGEAGGLFPILRSVRDADDVSTLHFHWLDPYVVDESLWRTIAKQLLTVLQLLFVRVLGIRVVWTVHNVVAHDSPAPRLERWFKRGFLETGACDGTFVHCKSVVGTLKSELGVRTVRSDVALIHHGHYIDNYENEISRSDARTELGLGSEETVYLFFGQIRPYKGVFELLRAFESLEGSNARLLVVGNPTTETFGAAVEERAEADERVTTVLEYVPEESIQTYMNAADVVVFPYQEITTSGSIVLAMSFGRAVIAPRLGCIPEILDDDGAILYAQASGELEQALTRARDRELAEMGGHNRRRVVRYDWHEIAATTQRVYAGDYDGSATGRSVQGASR